MKWKLELEWGIRAGGHRIEMKRELEWGVIKRRL